MKQVMIFALLVLMVNTAQAQIFKCETKKGKIVYQDKECTNSIKQREVVVHEFDANKILEAQEKLNRELQQREELKAARAKQELQERKIMAVEAQIRSNEELANAARENADAIERNTDAFRYGNQRSNLFFHHPLRHRPKQRPRRVKPITKPKKQRNEVKASIRIK